MFFRSLAGCGSPICELIQWGLKSAALDEWNTPQVIYKLVLDSLFFCCGRSVEPPDKQQAHLPPGTSVAADTSRRSDDSACGDVHHPWCAINLVEGKLKHVLKNYLHSSAVLSYYRGDIVGIYVSPRSTGLLPLSSTHTTAPGTAK
jgi:hypothetical protein